MHDFLIESEADTVYESPSLREIEFYRSVTGTNLRAAWRKLKKKLQGKTFHDVFPNAEEERREFDRLLAQGIPVLELEPVNGPHKSPQS